MIYLLMLVNGFNDGNAEFGGSGVFLTKTNSYGKEPRNARNAIISTA